MVTLKLSCDCGQRQTMNHIVDTCPLTKFEGGLNLLREAHDDAVIWLESIQRLQHSRNKWISLILRDRGSVTASCRSARKIRPAAESANTWITHWWEKESRKASYVYMPSSWLQFCNTDNVEVSRLFVIQVQRQQEQQHRIWHTQFHCSVVSPNIQGGPNNLHTLLQIYCRILPVEEFRKSVEIWQNYGHEFGAPFFGTPCTLNTVHAQLHPV